MYRKNEALSSDDMAGQITLEKNGKVLDFFPGEVSPDRITAIQVCHKPLAFQHILWGVWMCIFYSNYVILNS